MTRRVVSRLGLAFCLNVLFYAFSNGFAQSSSDGCGTRAVKVESGEICGKLVQSEGKTVSAFLGIPYAESTAGRRRWQPPVPKAPWQGQFQATKFGDICPQNDSFGVDLPQSEDCLSINVWTPDTVPATRFPVLVWIYGGAFKSGSSAQSVYDGAYLAAQQGLVVVTLNYRVGALGFLAGVGGLDGNYGFLDQQLALKWVNQNITRFGGDPGRVTLAGESAGASFVSLHMLSAPVSEPLFQRAVMMSNPLGLPYKTPAQARKVGLWYLAATGCYFSLDPSRCLRGKSVQEVLKGETSRLLALPSLNEGLATFITWAPAIDGTVLTQQPLAAAQNGGLSKPSIIGTNADEGVLFVAGLANQPVGRIAYGGVLSLLLGDAGKRILPLYPADGNDYRPAMERFVTDYLFFCPNQVLAGAAKVPVYTYQFTHPPSVTLWPKVPGCKDKACHSEGVPFWFHTLDAVGIKQPEEDALSREMSAYWGQFVRGEPLIGANGLEWPLFSAGQQYLRLDIPTAVFQPDKPQCGTLDSIGYEQRATLERIDRGRTLQNR